jgi:hypothetical protein
MQCISNLNSALKIYKDKLKKGDSFFGEKEEIKLKTKEYVEKK